MHRMYNSQEEMGIARAHAGWKFISLANMMDKKGYVVAFWPCFSATTVILSWHWYILLPACPWCQYCLLFEKALVDFLKLDDWRCCSLPKLLLQTLHCSVTYDYSALYYHH